MSALSARNLTNDLDDGWINIKDRLKTCCFRVESILFFVPTGHQNNLFTRDESHRVIPNKDSIMKQ